MKLYANKHRSELSFKVNDECCLGVVPVVTDRQAKLAEAQSSTESKLSLAAHCHKLMVGQVNAFINQFPALPPPAAAVAASPAAIASATSSAWHNSWLCCTPPL